MDLKLSVYEIMLRLFLAMIMGGAIGIEREYKNRPAGIRTHILVCMGATIIASGLALCSGEARIRRCGTSR